MNVRDAVIVVTGGGNGIGKALCERFHQEGARKVVVADLEQDSATAVAAAVEGDPFTVDVRNEPQIQAMVAAVQERHGAIDMFCSNAGIIALDGEPWWGHLGPEFHLAGHVGYPCDVPRLRGPCMPAGNAGARRGLLSQYGLRSGAAQPGW